MTRGSSGAFIILETHHVIKYGHRAAEQGAWLAAHQSVTVPRVVSTNYASYRMERLSSAPACALNHRWVLSAVIDGLYHNVWSRQPTVEYDEDATLRKVGPLAPPRLWTRLRDVHAAIDWNALRRGLTHGDPTFDNVMFRESTGQLVLIDPLPATPAVPDLTCVDVGKILQSAVGYEACRYGETERFHVTPRDVRSYVANDNEWTASLWWCAVHLLRAVPYMPTVAVGRELLRIAQDEVSTLL